MGKKNYNKIKRTGDGFYYKSGSYIRENGSMLGGLAGFGALLTGGSVLAFSNMVTSVTVVGAVTVTTVSGTILTAGVGLAVLGSSMMIAAGTAAIINGVRKYKNKNISKKLFNAINEKDSGDVEKILINISKEKKEDRYHIFNDIRDENGNTLINAVLSSNMDIKKKETIIDDMLKNGANFYERNANSNESPVDFVKNMPDSKEKHKLVNFIEEKNKTLLKKKKETLESKQKELKNDLEKLQNKKFAFFKKYRISKLKEQITKNDNDIKINNARLAESTKNITTNKQELQDTQKSTQTSNRNLEDRHQKTLAKNSKNSKSSDASPFL